jgi:hypothetical protein
MTDLRNRHNLISTVRSVSQQAKSRQVCACVATSKARRNARQQNSLCLWWCTTSRRFVTCRSCVSYRKGHTHTGISITRSKTAEKLEGLHLSGLHEKARKFITRLITSQEGLCSVEVVKKVKLSLCVTNFLEVVKKVKLSLCVTK